MTEGEEIRLDTLGIVLRHPDGTPYTKEEVLIKRRGALTWLPVYCSNDLVHGSWWFVWGSLGCVIFAIIPIIDIYSTKFNLVEESIPEKFFDATWALLIFSSFAFGLGSLAFVRAFEEPRQRPLFWWYKHLQNDELLGAWLFLLGTVPAVPYALIFFFLQPDVMYFGAIVCSIVTVLATALFVKACYPHDTEVRVQSIATTH